MAITAAFIGCGEVGRTFSAAMRENGAEVCGYDTDPARVRDAGLALRTLPELAAGVRYVLSTVTTRQATRAACAIAPHLGPGNVYVDLNSTAPSVKLEIAGIIRPTGAAFVEGAILGAVGVTGARTRIFTGGPCGETAAADLASAGLRVSFYSAEIGKASTFKMLRGIFSKGLEALLIELLVSGKRAGIEKDLWDDINELMTKNAFENVARNWIETHAGACERRYHEVAQIVETMQEAGIEPLMTSATERFFARSADMSLAERCGGRKPSSEELISILEGTLRGPQADR